MRASGLLIIEKCIHIRNIFVFWEIDCLSKYLSCIMNQRDRSDVTSVLDPGMRKVLYFGFYYLFFITLMSMSTLEIKKKPYSIL